MIVTHSTHQITPAMRIVSNKQYKQKSRMELETLQTLSVSWNDRRSSVSLVKAPFQVLPSLFLLRAAYTGLPGGPGVGKGTQCKKLADDLSAAHLSVGDLLRAEASRVLAEEGTDIVAIMEDGKLVPKELVQEVLKRYVDQKVQQGITRILLDGFPRSMDQMTLFESSVSIQNSIKSCSSSHLENAHKHAGIQDQSSSVLPGLQKDLA